MRSPNLNKRDLKIIVRIVQSENISNVKVVCISIIVDMATMSRDLLPMWHKELIDNQFKIWSPMFPFKTQFI